MYLFPYLMVGLYGACFVLRAELKSMFAKNGWDLMSSEPFFPILRSSLKIKSKWEKRNKEDKDSFERYGGSFWKGHWPYMENLWIVNIDVDTKFIIIKSIKSLWWPRWLDIKETLCKGRIWGISPPGKVPRNWHKIVPVPRNWHKIVPVDHLKVRWWRGWEGGWWSWQHPPCTESQPVCWQGREAVRLASHRESPVKD